VARGAALGARAAWDALLAVRHQLRRQPRRALPLPLLQARFRRAYLQRRRQGPRSDHTMLACLWDRQRLLLAQVGDSTVLLRRNGVWELPLPPAKGEFANQTSFLRPDTPARAIALLCCPAQEVEAVIAFSDGLEAAFLGAMPGDPSQLQVNGSLADLVHSEHRQRSQQPGYGDWLAQSLAAEALAQLSDDDRTLVIASR
ncbi:MAG: protein phosphatase 2C domain-containing protein, partial [Cyanobacteriota bacterium]|nr:protein phosphatase 2C domain-containing protein [Cyanobacteriota bacterium]